MKKLMLILSLIFMVGGFAQTAMATCPDGITAYWKLDETEGSDFEDFIGDKDGSGDTGPTDGAVNGGQLFDGSAEINVDADSSFNWLSTDSFSIEYWIKKSAPPVGSNQVALGRIGSSIFWFTGVTTEGKATFALGNTVENKTIGVNGSINIANGNWHHVVCVRNGDTSTNLLYVDGVLQDSAVQVYLGGFSSNSGELNIGWLDFDTEFHLSGALDEIALYDRALTQPEIDAHYNDGTGVDYCDGDSAPSAAPYPEGITSLWKLDETEGSDFEDSIGDKDGSGDTGPTDGAVNGGQLFDGSAEINVDADSSFNFLSTESFSIAYWIKKSAPPVGGNQVALGRSGSSIFWFTGVTPTTGLATFALGNGVESKTIGVNGSINIANGNWHHVVCVRNGDTNNNLLYVDGILQDSAVQVYLSEFSSNSGKLNMGWLDFLTGYHLEGALDEIAIYKRALTQPEIEAHYSAGSDGDDLTTLRPAPEAVADSASLSPDENTAVVLDGTGSTEGYDDAPITSYLWTQTGGSAVIISNDETATASFTAPEVDEAGETLSFELAVTASDDQESSDTIDINVVNVAEDTPEPEEDNTDSIQAYGSEDTISLESAANTTLSGSQALDESSYADAPEGITFPYGLFTFKISDVTPGGSTTMTITLPAGAAPTGYYKYGPTPDDPTNHWYSFMYDDDTETGAVINGNVITLHFVDGKRGDSDLNGTNGEITDPGGPTLGEETPASTGGGDGGGGSGCFIGSIVE